ncbi:MAG: 16S rRNA (guanine(966)-N(2))-methyltransferase RsmD [Magnetococcales bacterium]|nr:16S rRNA (guanine(966)-N(2))-methyltransferase RsmD [Magnetococcales bacterium]
MVRISGGSWRGRLLHVPADGWIRPSMGRVRESLFSMLAQHVVGATVLDLCAGCGLLGLEALSRGARYSFFVDLEWKAVQFIEKNVTLCGARTRSTVLQGNILHKGTLNKINQLANQQFADQKPATGPHFDLVFLDPPYRQGVAAVALRALEQSSLLTPGARIVVEQEAETGPETALPWSLVQNRRYGDTRILFWQKPTHAEDP